MNTRIPIWISLLLVLIVCNFYEFYSVEGRSDNTGYYKLFDMDKNTFDKTALRKNYYRLAKQYHPDKNPGDKKAEQKFKEITHAFEILNDDEKKRVYDMHGEEGIQGGFSSDTGFNAQDIFERFFGGGRGGGFDFFGNQGAVRRTNDVKVNFIVSLQDIYKGATLKIDLNRQKICSVCKGHGTKNPNDVKVCGECRGHGVKVVQKMIAPGFIQQFQTHCNACGGQGKTFKTVCGACDGKKVRRQSESIQFKVPVGAPEGYVIKLEEKADELPDHETGHIYIVLQSDQHPRFRRDGHDLHTTVEIDLNEALFGFTKTLDHLDGHKVTLHREEVTQPEFVHEILKKGFPVYDSEGHQTGRTGSLFVKYTVKLPKTAPSGQMKNDLSSFLKTKPDYDEL